MSNFFFTLFLRVANVRHFYVFGEIEKYMENTGIPPPNQLKSVTGSQVVGFLICFGLLLLLSSYSPALNVSRCFRIAIFIGFVFVILRNVNDVFLY